jgi:phage portal protein BeeE
LVDLAVLNLLFCILSILYIGWYQKFSYKLYYLIEQKDVSQDDFTILVENIPHIIFDSERKQVAQNSFNYSSLIRERTESKARDWLRELKRKIPEEVKGLPPLEKDFY